MDLIYHSIFHFSSSTTTSDSMRRLKNVGGSSSSSCASVSLHPTTYHVTMSTQGKFVNYHNINVRATPDIIPRRRVCLLE